MKRLLVLSYASMLASLLLVLGSSKGSHPEAERFDDPDAASRWELLRLRDPATGQIPYGMRAREVAFAERMNWRALKAQPTSIHSTGWSYNGPMNVGGRAQSLGIDIANEKNLIVATAAGGIWRSEDAGESWIKASQPDQLQDCFSLVQDHRLGKTHTWYCGTGELLSTTFRRVQVTSEPRWRTLDVGDGIYKSMDNGKSWSLLPSTFDTTRVDLDSAFDGVWNIVVDNSRSDMDIVYAAGYGAIVRSSDGGAHWARVLGDAVNKSFCSDVAITSTGVLYAYLSTTGTGTPSTAGIWRSTNGVQWTKITPTKWPAVTKRMKIAIAPSNESVVYIAGEAPKYSSGHAIWKYQFLSGDGSGTGGTWLDHSTTIPVSNTGADGMNTLGGYALALAVHPLDPSMVYLGGTNIFRSPDGFASESTIEWVGGYNPAPGGGQSYPDHHPDNHCFAFSAADPERMYNCNDAGVFVTDSCRALAADDSYYALTWRDLNAGLQASIIYTTSIDRATPGSTVTLGGFQDQGCWIGDATTAWEQTTGGDGCYTAMTDGGRTVFTSSQFATIYRLGLDVDHSLLSYAFIPPRLDNPQFVAPWMLDPADSKQMYVADSNVVWWNSNLDGIQDGNGDYTSINWNRLSKTFLNRPCVIGALAISTTPAHILFYGTSDGHVYKLTSTSGTPVELTSPLFPNDAFVSCIAVDPDDAKQLIVTFSNYHVRSIFATDDGGVNWRDISGNLEEREDGSGDGPSVRWASIVHQHGQSLYLIGTSVGLFSTADLGGNVQWMQESPAGIGRTIVEHMDVRQSDGFVAIATQGAGIWAGYVVADSLASASSMASTAMPVLLSPSPVVSVLRVTLPSTQPATATLFDASGRTLGEYHGSATVNIDCAVLPNGTYSLQIRQNGSALWRRFIVSH